MDWFMYVREREKPIAEKYNSSSDSFTNNIISSVSGTVEEFAHHPNPSERNPG